MNRKIQASKLRSDLAETLNRIAYQGERVVVERNGKEMAALISLEDLQLFEDLEDRMDVEAGNKALRAGGFRPYEELRTKHGLK